MTFKDVWLFVLGWFDVSTLFYFHKNDNWSWPFEMNFLMFQIHWTKFKSVSDIQKLPVTSVPSIIGLFRKSNWMNHQRWRCYFFLYFFFILLVGRQKKSWEREKRKNNDGHFNIQFKRSDDESTRKSFSRIPKETHRT